tara:strand:- start:479 stop:943 length:465 start_codon:yes stop_codon:yes gene_type:complete
MKARPITGRHVLIMILGFFAVTITVNAIFVTQAIRHFPGEDIPRSYMQGIAYNDTLAARQAQGALGWTAVADVTLEHVRIEIADAQGAPVSGLAISGRLRHPANASRDIPLALNESEPGRYEASLQAVPGSWRLVAQADGDGPPFEIEQALWLR